MYLAVDIGATKTLLASFSKSGALTDSIKFETPAVYETFLQELTHNVANLTTNKFLLGVVAVPGRIDRTKGIALAFGNLAWQHIPITANISRIIDCPVIIENDARLAGLSEARLAPGYKRVLYVTVSTGIGGALVIDGKIDKGTQNAEIGQILLEHEGKLERWEDFASGRAIVEKFGKRAGDIDAGDSQAWYVIARNIAVGLIDMIATLTPEVVIIGGGVGAHFDKFKDKLIEELKIYQNSLLTIPPILPAKHPEEAVIYGCYELAKDYQKRAQHAKAA